MLAEHCDTHQTLVCSCFYNYPTLVSNMNPIHLKSLNQHIVQTLRFCVRWISIEYHMNIKKKVSEVGML